MKGFIRSSEAAQRRRGIPGGMPPLAGPQHQAPSLPPFMPFISRCMSMNCLSSRLTSWTCTPAPLGDAPPARPVDHARMAPLLAGSSNR